MTNIKDWTVETAAREYVSLLMGTPNGLGQHVHPYFGQSHTMLRWMYDKFGEAETHNAIDAELRKIRQRVAG